MVSNAYMQKQEALGKIGNKSCPINYKRFNELKQHSIRLRKKDAQNFMTEFTQTFKKQILLILSKSSEKRKISKVILQC